VGAYMSKIVLIRSEEHVVILMTARDSDVSFI
jgi:hypothetical protein